MNRKNLTAAVLAGLAGVVGIAGSAQAVNVNPDGTGQVLLYPYYTVNNDNLTLLSVVNTSDHAKAVKVRFLESENSAEVLDFNLYMSAYDVWTAALVAMPDSVDQDCAFSEATDGLRCEGPLLLVADDETTCTVPNLNGAQAFLPLEYMLDDRDMGSKTQARMNEGHFEMLEMGALTTTDNEGDTVDSWAGEAATHGYNSDMEWEPADCDSLVAAWTKSKPFIKTDSGVWINDVEYGPEYGVEAPSGGLFGGAAVVNPIKGAMHSYEATALNGWNESGFDPSQGFVSLHTEPGSVQPNLQGGDNFEGLVFSESGEVLESGEFSFAEDAVSYVLMHDSLMNEYSIETNVAGQTEWVVTFPTKRFYVFDGPIDEAFDPFTTMFEPRGDDTLATACEAVVLNTVWDREERFNTDDPTCDPSEEVCDVTPPVVSPSLPGDIDPGNPGTNFELCYETNVIRFGPGSEVVDDEIVDITPDTTEILGTPKGFYRNIDTQGFQAGWARIEMDEYLETVELVDENGVVYGYDYVTSTRASLGLTDPLNGLPFIGFSVSRFANNFAPSEDNPDGFASYGNLYKHRSSRKVGSDAGGPVEQPQPVRQI